MLINRKSDESILVITVLAVCTITAVDKQVLQFSGLGFVSLGPLHCESIHLCF